MKSSSSSVYFRRSSVCMLFVFLLALFISFWGTAGYAASFTVTNTNDAGEGSLRQAIASAQSHEDVINFSFTSYPQVISLDSTLGIYHGLNVQGPGADKLFISGNKKCRVFFIAATSSVDISGISIVSGYSDNGGGMLNSESTNLTVTNCTFSSNTATNLGGGMFNNKSSPTLTNCTFSSNSAPKSWSATEPPSHCGGGMANYSLSSPTVTNCTFSSNSAYENGGGMFNYDNSNPIVTDCTFSSNTADNGGGMYNDSDSDPQVTNCIFTFNNRSGIRNLFSSPTVTNCIFSFNTGGGMYNRIDSDPQVTNCIFTSNIGSGMSNRYDSEATVTDCTFSSNIVPFISDSSHGGGMNNLSSDPKVTNCTFTANSADVGGGMYNMWSDPTVTNCTFSSNNTHEGGGMSNCYDSDPTVTNCTFTANSADVGGGMYNSNGSSPTSTNCIFWNGSSGEIYNVAEDDDPLGPSIPTLNCCIVQSDDYDLSTISGYVTSADPKLQNLADNGGPTQTCALGLASSALDAGIFVDTVSTDQRGVARPQVIGYDIGAYEYEPHDNGDGCNISALSVTGLLLVLPLMFLSGKMK